MTHTAHTTDTDRKIDFPDADTLDTGGCVDSYRLGLYLVPGAEFGDGIPAVVAHHSATGDGTPSDAYDRRALHLGGYGPGVSGESVRDRLESLADALLDVAETYLGNEWHPVRCARVGRWEADEAGEPVETPDLRLDEAARYWGASDWLANQAWPDLADDPLDDSGEQIDRLADTLTTKARLDDVLVDVGDMETVLAEMRDEWIDEQEDAAVDVLVDHYRTDLETTLEGEWPGTTAVVGSETARRWTPEGAEVDPRIAYVDDEGRVCIDGDDGEGDWLERMAREYLEDDIPEDRRAEILEVLRAGRGDKGAKLFGPEVQIVEPDEPDDY